MSNKYLTSPTLHDEAIVSDKKAITSTDTYSTATTFKRGLDVNVLNTIPVTLDEPIDVTSTDTMPGIGSLISGLIVDTVAITDPTSTTRAYAFKNGSTLLKTVTLTYISAALKPTLDVNLVVVT